MIIGVVGLIGSGKNAVGDYLVESCGFQKESFASPLKDVVAAVFGWNRELLEGITEESREFREARDEWWSLRLDHEVTPRWVLQHFGTEVFRNHFHKDIWIASLEKRLLGKSGDVVITDCRFPNEIDVIKRNKGFVIHVRKKELPEWWDYAYQYNRMMAGTVRQNEYTIAKALLDIKLKNPQELYGIHPSEWSWVGITPDWEIENDRETNSLEELHVNVKYALTALRGSDKLINTSEK